MRITKEIDLKGTELDIELPEKTSLDITIYVKDNGDAFELAEGDVVTFMVKAKKDDLDADAKITKNLTKVDLATAECRLQLAPSDTELPADRYYYAIYIQSGTDRWPVLYGRFTISEAVW